MAPCYRFFSLGILYRYLTNVSLYCTLHIRTQTLKSPMCTQPYFSRLAGQQTLPSTHTRAYGPCKHAFPRGMVVWVVDWLQNAHGSAVCVRSLPYEYIGMVENAGFAELLSIFFTYFEAHAFISRIRERGVSILKFIEAGNKAERRGFDWWNNLEKMWMK